MSSLFLSILKEKCPRCRKGFVFKFPVYKITHFHYMNELCPHCRFRYEIEPGFFWAAMYISYALGIGLSLFVGLLVYSIGYNPSLMVYLISIIGSIVIIAPFSFRYSRVILLYFFSGVVYQSEL